MTVSFRAVVCVSRLRLGRVGGFQVRFCEKRDVEKWLTTKALKANGLWRLGKYDEGLQLCLDVQVFCVTAAAAATLLTREG